MSGHTYFANNAESAKGIDNAFSNRYPGEGNNATGGDYYNYLAPFLGPATKAIDHTPSMRFPHEAWFLPDAYKGRNDYIRETIVQMLVNYNNFMCQEILPWRQQDNPNIAWDSIKFDKTLVDLEPEQGIPRYVTVEREAHTDYMSRRGLALIVNHGFAATEGGRKDFAYKVACIANATQETCDQSGIMAMLRCKNEYSSYLADEMRAASDAYQMFTPELHRFGIMQHSERGWYHIDEDAGHVMKLQNIQPDTWIVPPRMLGYAAMGQKAETEWYRAGDEARANLIKGADNFVTFRGKKVFETRPFTLDVDGRTVDPLNRERMIGDFFIVPGRNTTGNPTRHSATTQVYCCDSDRFETFDYDKLIEASGLQPGVEYAELERTGSDAGEELVNAMRVAAGYAIGDPTCVEAVHRGKMAEVNPHAARMFGHAKREPEKQKHALLQAHEQQNGNLHPVVKELVHCGIRAVHAVDPTSAAHAAAGWASELSKKGFSDEIARDATSQSIGEEMAKALQTAINAASPHEVASHIESLRADTVDGSDAAVANLLHQAHFDTGNTRQFNRMYKRAQSTAFANAARLVRARSELVRSASKFEVGEPATMDADEVVALITGNIDLPINGSTIIVPARNCNVYFGANGKREGGVDYTDFLLEPAQSEVRNSAAAVTTFDQFKELANAPHVHGGDSMATAALESHRDFFNHPAQYNLTVRSAGNNTYTVTANYEFNTNDPLNARTAIEHSGVDTREKAKEARVMEMIKPVAPPTRPARPRVLEAGVLEAGVLEAGVLEAGVLEAGVRQPDLLCIRPFRRYKMGTGILCKRGEELGNTFRGWADFQLTDNIIAKTHIGHFTFWHASVVTNPKCLFLAEDIFCTNYVRGEGGKVLHWNHREAFSQDPVATMDSKDASIIVLPIPGGSMAHGQRLAMNNPISLTGQLDPVSRAASGGSSRCKVDIGAYWGGPPEVAAQEVAMLHDYFNRMWGFDSMNHPVDYDEAKTFETAGRVINIMAFHTMQKFPLITGDEKLATALSAYHVTNLNTGHFGENGIYEGVKKIRCGYIDYFKDMEYQKLMSRKIF